MREGWELTRLAAVSDRSIGRTPPRNDLRYWTTSLERPFCTIADMKGRTTAGGSEGITLLAEREAKAKRVPAGALLLSFKLSLGRTAVAVRDLFPNEAIAWLRPRPPMLQDFLAIALEVVDWDSLGDRAVKGKTLNAASLDAVPIILPPLSEQRRIVDLVAALDDTIAAADPARARGVYDAMLGALAGRSDVSPLSQALSAKRAGRLVEPESEYRILGVLRSGQGFIDRGAIRGAETGYAKMFQVGVDELVYRKLTAWEGPISVSTEVECGGWVSPEFPIFTIDQTVLRPGLMRHFCRWPGFWQRIGDRLVGSVQRRKRLNPEALVGIELPMPPLEVQDAWLQALDAMWEVVAARSVTVSALQRTRSNLLKALLSGEHEIPESYDELMRELS